MSDVPEAEAYSLPIETVVARLVGITGVSVTGIIGNIKSEWSVRQWVTGECRPEREQQLRFAYHIAGMIAARCGPLVVQSWFKGANASLDDRAPAILLRDDFSDETQRRVLNAARRLMQ